MVDEIRKCLVCAMGTQHKFKDCANQACDCVCIEEIRGEEALPFDEFPQWFRLISRKDTKRFDRAHTKRGK